MCTQLLERRTKLPWVLDQDLNPAPEALADKHLGRKMNSHLEGDPKYSLSQYNGNTK